MNNKYSAQDWQLISAYLDGQLSPKEKTRLEARLGSETALKQAFLDIRQTKLLLSHAKTIKAPRNFTLTEEQARSIKPVRTLRFLPILSISSALATIMMIFAIFFELSSGPRMTANVAMEPAAEILSMQAAPQMDSSREVNDQTNPMIIQWGSGATGMGGGGAPDYTAKSGSELPGMGGADPGAINTVPLPEAPTESVLSASPEEVAEPIVGTGPILGIRTEDEASTYNQAVMEILEEQANASKSSIPSAIPMIRWVQTGLALVALVTGSIALLLWRKSKI